MIVNEIFRSLQGEGAFQGLPTCFVRLAGCNLACVYCDTAYARDNSSGTDLSIEEILFEISGLGKGPVCVTGGEPLAQAETPALIEGLLESGRTVSVETNGSLDVGILPSAALRVLDIKCPASLMSHRILWSNLERLRRDDEIKFVIRDRDDYVWAREVIRNRRLERICRLLMGPVYGALHPSVLAEWILEDGLQVRFNLQLHKYIWGPDREGV